MNIDKKEFSDKIKNAVGYNELEKLSLNSIRKLENRLIHLYFIHECDLSKLSIAKIQQEYLKIINNEDFQEINNLDIYDIT